MFFIKNIIEKILQIFNEEQLLTELVKFLTFILLKRIKKTKKFDFYRKITYFSLILHNIHIKKN